jgi:hypothetical protein
MYIIPLHFSVEGKEEQGKIMKHYKASIFPCLSPEKLKGVLNRMFLCVSVAKTIN